MVVLLDILGSVQARQSDAQQISRCRLERLESAPGLTRWHSTQVPIGDANKQMREPLAAPERRTCQQRIITDGPDLDELDTIGARRLVHFQLCPDGLELTLQRRLLCSEEIVDLRA